MSYRLPIYQHVTFKHSRTLLLNCFPLSFSVALFSEISSQKSFFYRTEENIIVFYISGMHFWDKFQWNLLLDISKCVILQGKTCQLFRLAAKLYFQHSWTRNECTRGLTDFLHFVIWCSTYKTGRHVFFQLLIRRFRGWNPPLELTPETVFL